VVKITIDSGNFELQLEQFGKSITDNMERFAQRFCQDLANEIVEATPVKTGFLRASWKPNVNGADADATSLEVGDVFELINTATYARRVEFGFMGTDSLGRHYTQSGRAFVRGVLNRADLLASTTLAGMT
jgi:uncharacterized protein CbrC (UPF0167 family)